MQAVRQFRAVGKTSRAARRFRALVVAAVVPVGPACVLPIGPEFEPERNVAPVVLDVVPREGSHISNPNQSFIVVLEDPNTTDTVYTRWLIDYPPYNEELSREGPGQTLASRGQGIENRHRIAFQPNCEQLISPALTRHRLMLVISDRPFLPVTDPTVDRRYDLTPSDANVVRLSWTFDFDKDCS